MASSAQICTYVTKFQDEMINLRASKGTVGILTTRRPRQSPEYLGVRYENILYKVGDFQFEEYNVKGVMELINKINRRMLCEYLTQSSGDNEIGDTSDLFAKLKINETENNDNKSTSETNTLVTPAKETKVKTFISPSISFSLEDDSSSISNAFFSEAATKGMKQKEYTANVNLLTEYSTEVTLLMRLMKQTQLTSVQLINKLLMLTITKTTVYVLTLKNAENCWIPLINKELRGGQMTYIDLQFEKEDK